MTETPYCVFHHLILVFYPSIHAWPKTLRCSLGAHTWLIFRQLVKSLKSQSRLLLQQFMCHLIPYHGFNSKKKKKKFSHRNLWPSIQSYAQWENWYTNIVLTHVLNDRDVNNMHHGWPLPCLCTALSSALNVLFSWADSKGSIWKECWAWPMLLLMMTHCS